jgi:hypothetical protein
VGHVGQQKGAEGQRIVNRRRKPKVTIAQILAWADDHHRRTGQWPHADSGPITGANTETWRGIEHALCDGRRGLPAGGSLARLLARKRGLRNRADLPPLTVRQILRWADAYHQRNGDWPTEQSGPIPGSHGETWRGVDGSLRYGFRGLRSGSSLPRLLAEKRGRLNRLAKQHLTHAAILTWADAHHRRTGSWPSAGSGPVFGVQGETWRGIDLAMQQGWRGMRRGLSLARLLAQERRARNRANLPRITEAKVLMWADEHYRLTGSWPTQDSGLVNNAPEETWNALDLALRGGYRGLPGGSSLARLLDRRRRNPKGG